MRRRRCRDLSRAHYHHIRRPRPPERRRRPRHEVRPRDGHCRSPRRRTTTRAHTADRGRRHVRVSVRQTPSLRVRVGHYYIHRPRRMRRCRRRDLAGTHHHHIRRRRPAQRHRRPGHKVRPRDTDCRPPRRRTTTRTHTADRGRYHVRESVRQTPNLRVRVGHYYIHRPRRMRRCRRCYLAGAHYHHIRRPRPAQRHRRPDHEVRPRDGHCRAPRRRTTARTHSRHRRGWRRTRRERHHLHHPGT